MADHERVERQAVVWPVGSPVDGDKYTSVRFSITPGVGSIVNPEALGDMTAEVTKNTPGMATASVEVTHDSSEATSGIVYFGYRPGRGDLSHQTVEAMKPTLDYVLSIVSPVGALAITHFEADPVVDLMQLQA